MSEHNPREPLAASGVHTDTAPTVWQRARIKPHMLAAAMVVGRVTASRWINGHTKPHRYLAERAQALQHAVEQALARGDLPVRSGLTPAQEREHFRAAIGDSWR